MANWLDVVAGQDDEFSRNGGELFRNLKAACSSVVDTYRKRYSADGAELVDCSTVNPNCFRVRMAGPTDRFVEVYFRPETKSISISRHQAGPVPGQQQPLTGTVEIGHSGDAALVFLARLTPNQSNVTPVVAEDLSRYLLEPLFFPTGIRPEPK